MAVLSYYRRRTTDEPVTDDRPCRLCGTSLRGRRATERCGKCGEPVGATLHGDLLAYADPKWLDRLRDGLHTLVVAAIAGVGLAVALVWWVSSGGGAATPIGYSRPSSAEVSNLLWTQVVYGLVGLASLALFARGAWLVSTPDPDKPTVDVEGAGARQSVRILVVLSVGTAALDVLLDACFAVVGTPRYASPGTAATYGFLCQLLQAALMLALGYQLGRTASRVPSPATAAWARGAGWGSAVSVVILAAVALNAVPEFGRPSPHAGGYAAGLLLGGLLALASVVSMTVVAGSLAGEVGRARKAAFALMARPFRAPSPAHAGTGPEAGAAGVVPANGAVSPVSEVEWDAFVAGALKPAVAVPQAKAPVVQEPVDPPASVTRPDDRQAPPPEP